MCSLFEIYSNFSREYTNLLLEIESQHGVVALLRRGTCMKVHGKVCNSHQRQDEGHCANTRAGSKTSNVTAPTTTKGFLPGLPKPPNPLKPPRPPHVQLPTVPGPKPFPIPTPHRPFPRPGDIFKVPKPIQIDVGNLRDILNAVRNAASRLVK